MKEIVEKIKNTVSGERTFFTVREISNFHRIQASTGFRAAAQHVHKRLEQDGIQTKICSYPADGKTWYLTQKIFKEWDCKDARLDLVLPARRLADFKTNNTSIIQKSYPCDYRNQPLDIVLLDKGADASQYEDLELKGKLIFIREHFDGYMDWAVKEKCAAGIISDFVRPMKGVRERGDLYDILNYTSFWWKHTDDEPQVFGFILTPREGDRLAEVCRSVRESHAKDPTSPQYPQATCYVDSAIYEGAIEVVEAFLPGETDEELMIVSHLCHPRSSANDNASGVSASMEAVKVLKELTESGQLAPLKRGVRVIFVPEFTGTYAYLHELGDGIKKVRAGINLDMVGGRQTRGYGPLTISTLPHAVPSFVTDLAALVLDEVKISAPANTKETYVPMFNSLVAGFEAGSDHAILSDPAIGVPAVMLGQWPDLYYHTSGDTVEVIDPFILHKSASICAAYIYLLANLTEQDVRLVMNKGRQRFTDTLSQQVNQAVESGMPATQLRERFNHYTDYQKACNTTFTVFFSAERAEKVAEMVRLENDLLDALSAALWNRYLQDEASGFKEELEEAPSAYRYIPVRKFGAPLIHLDDFALGNEQRMADYKAHMKNNRAALHSGFSFDAILQYYIDGKRSVWHIARQAMIETGDGSLEYVHQFIQLLKSFDLVEIVGEQR